MLFPFLQMRACAQHDVRDMPGRDGGRTNLIVLPALWLTSRRGHHFA